MAPNVTSAPTDALYHNDISKTEAVDEKPRAGYKITIVWTNVVIFTMIHLGALYGLYRVFTSAKLITTIAGKLLAD